MPKTFSLSSAAVGAVVGAFALLVVTQVPGASLRGDLGGMTTPPTASGPTPGTTPGPTPGPTPPSSEDGGILVGGGTTGGGGQSNPEQCGNRVCEQFECEHCVEDCTAEQCADLQESCGLVEGVPNIQCGGNCPVGSVCAPLYLSDCQTIQSDLPCGCQQIACNVLPCGVMMPGDPPLCGGSCPEGTACQYMPDSEDQITPCECL